MEIIIKDLGLLRVFQEVALKRSFTLAAVPLHMELPNVSKKISKLETELGVALFHRSTRKVSLTAEGERLLQQVDTIFENIREIEEGFSLKKLLAGRIRVACLPGLAHRVLVPALKDFKRLYPDIEFDVDLSDRVVDLVDERIDVAIRVQTPKGSDLIYRKFLSNKVIFCASPDYLEKAPPVRYPNDLRAHPILCLDVHKGLKFKKSQTPLSDYILTCPVRSGSGLFMTELAMAGMGIALRSLWDVESLLKRKKLQQILPHFPVEDFGNVYVVSAAKRALNARSKVFIEHLMSYKSGAL